MPLLDISYIYVLEYLIQVQSNSIIISSGGREISSLIRELPDYKLKRIKLSKTQSGLRPRRELPTGQKEHSLQMKLIL